jgi:hypothetical protein
MAGIAVGVAALSGMAQQKPDFSGVWAATKDTPSKLPMAPTPVLGASLELRHKDNALTFVRPRGEFSIEGTYPIGGPEVRMRSPGGMCRGDVYFIDIAAWEGNALAFTTTGTVPAGGGPRSQLSIKRLLHLEAADTLVVEGTIVQGGQSQQVATVYKRSTDKLPPLAATLPATKAAATIADAEWIAGTWWKDPATPTGSATEERWTPPAGGSMLGTARTITKTSMPAFEFLCIVERDGSLVYTAMPNGRSPATDFVLTQLTPDSLTFENPQHDFPKVIKYSKKADGSLETAISGAPGSRVVMVTLVKK